MKLGKGLQFVTPDDLVSISRKNGARPCPIRTDYSLMVIFPGIREIHSLEINILAGRVGENPYTALLGPISTTSTKYGTAIQNHFVYDADSKTITLDDDCTATPFILGGSSTEGWTFQTASGYLNLYDDDNCLNTVSEVGNGSK